MFAYDASDGAVSGVASPWEQGKTRLAFDPEKTYIPPLDWRTTRVLGLPIPPPLKIEIDTRELSVRSSVGYPLDTDVFVKGTICPAR